MDDSFVTKATPISELGSTMHRTMHGQVVQSLGLDIVSGRFPPGAALPAEPVLCEQLEVSRGALREAVKALAAKGLLELRPRTGTRVRPQSDWNLLDSDMLKWLRVVDRDGLITQLTEIRELIEPGAAEFAALRATERDRADLVQAYEAMEAAASAAGHEGFNAADVRFHRVLLRLSHNPLLAALNGAFEIALHTTFETTSAVPGGVARTLPLHLSLVEAILNADPDGAAAAARTLIRTSTANFREVQQRGEPVPPS
jgi:DNA-binding FadR family transcriptional regulator